MNCLEIHLKSLKYDILEVNIVIILLGAHGVTGIVIKTYLKKKPQNREKQKQNKTKQM